MVLLRTLKISSIFIICIDYVSIRKKKKVHCWEFWVFKRETFSFFFFLSFSLLFSSYLINIKCTTALDWQHLEDLVCVCAFMYNNSIINNTIHLGTNGYVTRNLSFVKPPPQRKDELKEESGPKLKKANAAILEHNRKRQVEVKCMELRIKLEDEG